jgi:adenylate cyclase
MRAIAVARRRLRDAIALDANSTTAYSLYGQLLAMENEPDEAIEQFEQAMRLSPRDSDLWSVQTALALCHFVAERYNEMLESAQSALRSRPEMPFPHGTVGVALTCLDRIDEARAVVTTMLALEPRTCVRGLRAIVASTNPDIVERYVSALRRAGVPE